VTPKEMKMVATSLHQNVLDCWKALLHAARNFDYYNLDAYSKETEQLIFEHDEAERLSPELGARLQQLFKSEAIQRTFSRRSEFWLLDSFPYYMTNLERFCDPNFEPTEEDSVMARIRTTGIVESLLEQKIVPEDPNEPDVIRFQVVDVGGQRNERKKWIHCFSDVKAILFIVNLAGYNQVLFEDSSVNRMAEELELFEKTTHNEIFASTPIFLFLNKKDLFESMVTEVDMSRTFSDYTGGKNLQAALEYIENQFRSRLPPGKTVEIQVVSARWKRDIRSEFEEVKKRLYDMNRKMLFEQAKKIKNQKKQVTRKQQRAASGQTGVCCGAGAVRTR